MTRWLNRSSTVLAGIAVVLISLGLAGRGPFFSIAPAQSVIRVEDSEQTFTEAASGALLKFPFKLYNESGSPLHVVGATTLCGPSGCITVERESEFPLEIPQGVSRTVTVVVKAGNAGPFSMGVTLFTDATHSSRIQLRVSGRIITPPGLGTRG